MLNLSDKELDRISREAADQHDPGDLMGPRAWDRLELRLDNELGRVGPNPLRGIRRFPFHYAPVLLLVAAVSYFAIRQFSQPQKAASTGSPPVAAAKAPEPGQTSSHSSTKITETYKTTSTPGNTTLPSNKDLAAGDPAAGNPVSGNSPEGPASNGTSPVASGAVPRASGDAADRKISGMTSGSTHRRRGNTVSGNRTMASGATPIPGPANGNTASRRPPGNPSGNAIADGPSRSRIRGPLSLTGPHQVSDSALRAYTAPVAATPGRSLHINRSLQIGLLLAPDFSSVNSLAGDHPGSSFGITLDYQLWNRWHIGTGFLYSKKNYTARTQDYHVSYDYLRTNDLKNIDFIKGSLTMLEVPVNIRYDFSVTGNTLFFASVGASTYFFPNENCNYYFDFFGREAYRNFKYHENKIGLFSAVNLSVGVEAGISNSLSLLLAPYVKLPTGDIGFGEIKMNSVGINFGLKYAPVISRKRH